MSRGVGASARGAALGAALGLIVIHGTAALAAHPDDPWGGLVDAYTADFGFLAYHTILGALLGAVVAWIINHQLETRIRLEQEQEHLEREVLQAQKLETIGRLASGVAHDFNNILSAVGLQLHLAAEYPKNRERNIGKARAAIRRAARLPQQLLTYSREGEAEAQALDPNLILHEVVELMERTTGRGVELSLVAGDVQAVHIDPVQLEQVVMNLVVNARDATDEGTITVGSRRQTDPEGVPPGDYVELYVADTGSGIPPEIQQKIFDPFFTTKGEGKGTGLGLATCKRIAQEAGGTLQLESQPGHTVFRVLLPEVTLPKSELQGESELVGGTERVVVADDDPVIRNSVAEVLESAGYQVQACRNGIDALRAVRQAPDMLIADIGLSGISGIDLARRAASEELGTRVLLISSEPQEGTMPAGARVLHKPIQPEKLLSTVRRTLDA